MPGSCGPWDLDPHAPDSEALTTVVRRGSWTEIDKRLAAAERKLSDDIEPRLIDIEINRAVESFIVARNDGPDDGKRPEVLSQQEPKMPTHPKPTEFGKQNAAVDDLEQLKREIKSELKEELLATLKHDLRTHVYDSNRISKQSETASSSSIQDRDGACVTNLEISSGPIKMPTPHRGLRPSVLGKEAPHMHNSQSMGEAWLIKTEERFATLEARIATLECELEQNRFRADGSPQPCQEIPSTEDDVRELNITPVVQSQDILRSGSIEGAIVPDMFFFALSVWDACVIICMPEVGIIASCFVGVGLLFNIALQGVACLLMAVAFVKDDDSLFNLEEVEQWRFNAHHIARRDPVTKATLVSKVCNTAFTENDWWQHMLLQTIEDWTAEVLGCPVGLAVNCLALAMWFLSIAVEICNTTRFFRAIICIASDETESHLMLRFPSGSSTRSSEEPNLAPAISRSRKLCLFVIVALRLIVAVALASAGAVWITRTKDPETALLNAVALLFVLDLDEVLFKCIADTRAQLILMSLEPVPLPNRLKWKMCHGRVLFNLLLLTVVIPTMVWLLVMPHVRLSHDVEEMLCGGRQDFVYNIHPRLHLPVISRPIPSHKNYVADEFQHRAETLSKKAVLAAIFDRAAALTHDSIWWQSSDLDVAVKVKAVEEIGKRFVDLQVNAWINQHDASEQACTNRNEVPNNTDMVWRWKTIRATTLSAASTCEELGTEHCDFQWLPLVRLMCPDTCGCHSAFSGLYYQGGCKMNCQTKTYKNDLAIAPCSDSRSAVLRPAFDRVVRALAKFDECKNNGTAAFLAAAKNLNCSITSAGHRTWFNHLAKQGEFAKCSMRFLSSICRVDTWGGGAGVLRSLAPFCPQACECSPAAHQNIKQMCPASCLVATSTTTTAT